MCEFKFPDFYNVNYNYYNVLMDTSMLVKSFVIFKIIAMFLPLHLFIKTNLIYPHQLSERVCTLLVCVVISTSLAKPIKVNLSINKTDLLELINIYWTANDHIPTV